MLVHVKLGVVKSVVGIVCEIALCFLVGEYIYLTNVWMPTARHFLAAGEIVETKQMKSLLLWFHS